MIRCEAFLTHIAMGWLAGASPGFLSERGVICIKVWGVALLILSDFYLISHENKISWSH